MFTIALLTCQRLSNLTEPDQSLIPLFRNHGITAEPVIWNDPNIDWKKYDYLIIRNTWDYYTQSDAFIKWLNALRDQKIRMLNPIDVVLNNMHKFYLRDFQQNGVQIISTLFSDKSSPISFEKLTEKSWQKIVIKPAISAGSYLTKTFETSELTKASFDEIVEGNDWLIQPFLPEIEQQGELSMIFFNNEFSHAIVKIPKDGDFRVQRQYGGKYQMIKPDKQLITIGENIIKQIPQKLLYARVDGVIINGVFNLMELELIEPDLYFEFGDDICHRFVTAVLERIK
jgi:glutathione synthase/RimK-type ligase-like ATP-grasp enzyme